MRRASRVDDNQARIVAAMRKMGAQVEHLHTVGNGVPDLLVGVCYTFVLVEVKDGSKVASRRKLTAHESAWQLRFQGYPVYIVSSVTEAVNLVTDLRIGLSAAIRTRSAYAG